MKYVYTLLLSFLAITSFAEELTPNTEKIKEAYRIYLTNTNAAQNQVNFINNYPGTKEAFLEVFLPASREQLYDDRAIYMETLVALSKVYPREVMVKSIGIGKGMVGAGDITGQLQHMSLDLSVAYTAEFASEVSKWKKADQQALMNFLTDIDDRDESIQVLANNLRALGENKLASMLENRFDAAKKKAGE